VKNPFLHSLLRGGVLHVGLDMGILSLFPEVYPLAVSVFPFQLLDGDGSVSLIDLFELGVLGLLVLFLCELGPDLLEE
jgi:hypothetical protein